MRRMWKAGWILLLIGFGIFFGIDQAAKQQGQSPWAVHPSYWAQTGGAEGRAAAGGSESRLAATGGVAPVGVGTPAETGTSAGANGGARAETLGQSAAAAAARPTAIGVGTDEAAWGEPTSRIVRSSDSFLNRLGNKLGEAVRGLFSAVIGWIVDMFNQLLR